MKKTVISAVLAVISLTLNASGDFDNLSLKASRFIDQKEWASAAAMLDLMLDEKPADADLYGKAIVVADIRNDSINALRLIDRAMEFHVPFDSVFSSVKTESFALGRSDLYERFLLSVADHQPWLSRIIDGYLMNYYAFRRNGSRMIEYADRLLHGLPDDVTFLRVRAQGLLLTGRAEEAMQTYRHVVAVDPDNYEALLYLGNYYYSLAADNRSNREYPVLAGDYLSRAAAIRPTPYVDKMLKRPHQR